MYRTLFSWQLPVVLLVYVITFYKQLQRLISATLPGFSAPLQGNTLRSLTIHATNESFVTISSGHPYAKNYPGNFTTSPIYKTHKSDANSIDLDRSLTPNEFDRKRQIIYETLRARLGTGVLLTGLDFDCILARHRDLVRKSAESAYPFNLNIANTDLYATFGKNVRVLGQAGLFSTDDVKE